MFGILSFEDVTSLHYPDSELACIFPTFIIFVVFGGGSIQSVVLEVAMSKHHDGSSYSHKTSVAAS